MYNRPNTQRIQQLLEDGHDAGTARDIDRMERRENVLLDRQKSCGLTDDEQAELESLQAELAETSGSPAQLHPSDRDRTTCDLCGGKGTIEVDTDRGTIGHTCLCVNPGLEAYGVRRVVRRLSHQRDQQHDKAA
jgi:hypothetical protein